ncbi:MAG TPA: MerR family transcriptional regulator [Actinomycetota bacterium]|nr:MerR family transcriptional regulator [Actinomycetota bacterium]
MRLRVDELAARAGVSVDTVRFYQARGLLPPPERDGRVAWYSGDHLDRLGRIRKLKDDGFNLTSIKRLLADDLDPADAALVSAVARSGAAERHLTLEGLAGATGISAAVLGAIEREGLLSGSRAEDGTVTYPESEVETIRAGLRLLETGLPLSELLALAREHDAAMRPVAAKAVDMFLTFVRDPIRAAGDEDAAGSQLVAAFETMLPAATALIAGHFRRLLLEAAEERMAGEDAPQPGG